MGKYVTHQFAHVETLDRAERWLLQLGFRPTQIEAHREGVPTLSVYVSPELSAEAEMVIHAAEASDPDGWPSFWDLARIPHPHLERKPKDPVATEVVTARPSPIGWHPSDQAEAARYGPDFSEVWDVTTRFTGK